MVTGSTNGLSLSFESASELSESRPQDAKPKASLLDACLVECEWELTIAKASRYLSYKMLVSLASTLP
jgi:hypothetical protein